MDDEFYLVGESDTRVCASTAWKGLESNSKLYEVPEHSLIGHALLDVLRHRLDGSYTMQCTIEPFLVRNGDSAHCQSGFTT